MNRIYKVIWSHVRNGYVVVSELAKGRGKVAAQKSARVLTAAVLGMVLGGAALPAYAETPTLPVTSDLTHTIAGSSFLVDKTGSPSKLREAVTRRLLLRSSSWGASTVSS